jgi:hypothetical protein
MGKQGKSKSKDNRPARKNYWAGHHLKRNKIARIKRCTRVYDDPALFAKEGQEERFACPTCELVQPAENVKARSHIKERGVCPNCGEYRLKTRPLTDSEALEIWQRRKRYAG